MKSFRLLWIVLAGLFLCVQAEADDLAVVGHQVSLSPQPETLLNVYLFRLRQDDAGQTLEPVTLSTDDAVFGRFTAQCLHRNPQLFSRRWRRSRYSGEGEAPLVAKDWKQMAQLLLTSPGRVGYLPKSELSKYPQLKVIFICGKH